MQGINTVLRPNKINSSCSNSPPNLSSTHTIKWTSPALHNAVTLKSSTPQVSSVSGTPVHYPALGITISLSPTSPQPVMPSPTIASPWWPRSMTITEGWYRVRPWPITGQLRSVQSLTLVCCQCHRWMVGKWMWSICFHLRLITIFRLMEPFLYPYPLRMAIWWQVTPPVHWLGSRTLTRIAGSTPHQESIST